MPMIEISMKETQKGTQIKLRERLGRNHRGRWQVATIHRSRSLLGNIYWQAIRYTLNHILKCARANAIPDALIPSNEAARQTKLAAQTSLFNED